MKKLSIFLLMFLSAFLLVACKDEKPTPPVEGDTTPPAFVDAVGGKLREISHLEGDEYDFDGETIKVMDNETADAEIVITIDKKTYDNTKPGTYTITYTAKDKAGNQASVDRTVTVLEAVEATFPAIVIGDTYIRYDLNNTDSFDNVGTNARFRLSSEQITVMDKDFYLEQLTEHASEWTENNGIPSFAWGTVVVLDENNKVVQARFAQGAQMQMDANGDLLWGAEDFPWYVSSGAGNLLVGLGEEDLDVLIPNGGKILLAAANTAPAPDLARMFLINNTFWTGYVGGGGVVKDVQDVDVTAVQFTFVEEYTVKVEKPAPIETPVVEINRHVLSWNAVSNARGYNLYINGVKFNEELLQADPIKLLELEELEVGKTYEIQVEAITMDELKWSSAELTEALVYDRIEIKVQENPVLSYNEETKKLEWTVPVGSDKFELYAEFAGVTFFVTETTESSLDPHVVAKDYAGATRLFVKSIGTDEYSDSQSEKVLVNVDYETKDMVVNGMTTKVVYLTAANYFTRRNATDATKLENYIYIVTGVKEYMDSGKTINEAFSTVALLDSDNKVKFVRNILAKQTYSTEDGWFVDEEYTGNNAQLVKLDKYIEAGDQLLIGKNGLNANYEIEGETKEATARDFVAYHLIKDWVKFPATTGSLADGGWRVPITEFVDSKTVVITFK